MAQRKRSKSKRRSSSRSRSRATAKRTRRSYAANPRTRKRSAKRSRSKGRRYRRNPGMDIVGNLKGLAIETGAGLGGVAVGTYIMQNFGPKIVSATDKPTVAAAKQFALGATTALVVRLFGGKFVNADIARAAALGVMIPASKALIYALATGDDATKPAPTFLGASDRPSAYRPVRGGMRGYAPAGRQLNGYARGNSFADPRMAAYSFR